MGVAPPTFSRESTERGSRAFRGGEETFGYRTYDRMMRAWVEVPDEWGWGALRILRGRLEDDGYHTGEYRTAPGVMIRLSGAKLTDMADPPTWRGRRQAQ